MNLKKGPKMGGKKRTKRTKNTQKLPDLKKYFMRGRVKKNTFQKGALFGLFGPFFAPFFANHNSSKIHPLDHFHNY